MSRQVDGAHTESMDDADIFQRIKALVDEEHALADDAETPPERSERRRMLEEQLDQCWDLLRQRQAKREFGQDPAESRARTTQNVENYLQ
jgi:hypothetical protein